MPQRAVSLWIRFPPPTLTDLELSFRLTTMTRTQAATPKQENFFLNIGFNVFLPVIVLEQLSTRMGEQGPLIALIVAVSLPLGYGAYDWIRFQRRNWLSALGFVSVLLTGGLGLFELTGIWFVAKESGFPLILGIGALISAFSKKPFMEALFFNPQLLSVERIQEQITRLGKGNELKALFKRSTFYFSGSFFLSAALNYWLAARIFLDIDESLPALERKTILNQQIAEMTWKSQIAIVIPLMVISMLVLGFFLKRLKDLSQLSLEELMVKTSSSQSSST